MTKDIDSITNSVLQVMGKEFDKNGMGGAFHRLYRGNRALVETVVASVVADHLNEERKAQNG